MGDAPRDLGEPSAQTAHVERPTASPISACVIGSSNEAPLGSPDHVQPDRSSMKAHRLDVRTDHGPLARPVLAYGLAAMDVATIHTVGPGDIIGEHGQHAVYVPRVEAIVDAFKEFDVTTITPKI